MSEFGVRGCVSNVMHKSLQIGPLMASCARLEEADESFWPLPIVDGDGRPIERFYRRPVMVDESSSV